MSEFANKSRRLLQFPNEPRIITATSPEMKSPPKPQKPTYAELEAEHARLRQGLREVRDIYVMHKELGGDGRAALMLEAAVVALATLNPDNQR